MDNSTELLCLPGTGQEQDWKNLYQSTFPKDEKADELGKLICAGTMGLHRTVNKAGELLCFSLIFPCSDFVLLSYLATDPTKRSGGYGSKHMKKLIELLKAQYPNHLGLFLEIESTKESGLDAATLKTRQRRLDFYQRLQAKRLCKNYMTFSLGNMSLPPSPGELLWIEWGGKVIDDAAVARVIKEIYEKGYNLPANHPVVVQVLSQFSNSSAGTASTCPVPAVAASTTVTPAAPVPAGSTGGDNGAAQPAVAASTAVTPAAPVPAGSTGGDNGTAQPAAAPPVATPESPAPKDNGPAPASPAAQPPSSPSK